MKRIIISLVILFSFPICAQIKHPFKSFSDFNCKLDSVCGINDSLKRSVAIDSFFDMLRENDLVPFTFKDTVAFLYRGKAGRVRWVGDFNGWNPNASNYYGVKLGKSNVWFCKNTFPVNARLDYKIVVDSVWMVDPENRFTQFSGVSATNSELRMPDWIYPQEAIFNSSITHGNLSENSSISSNNLGYTVYYRVYTPYGYGNYDKLPVIYTTDGQEYAGEKLGCMINVLDNLIFKKMIRPVIAVFIDPRSVPDSTGKNRRGEEYTINKKYADFVADELVPLIDSNYKTDSSPDERAILGTSLGGINSAYFGVYRSDKFHLIGINSPAFQAKPEIYNMYRNANLLPLKIFMSTGTISDTQLNALLLKSILEEKEYPLMYIEVPEGHSWGNWRALLDEVLIYFYKM